MRDLRDLRAATKWGDDRHLVFPNEVGNPVHVENLRRRVLRPRWLGQSDPSLTLRTYVHGLDRDDLGGPLELAAETRHDRNAAAEASDAVV